jgi:hypothetical protein
MIRNILDNQDLDPIMQQLFQKNCKGLAKQNMQIYISNMNVKGSRYSESTPLATEESRIQGNPKLLIIP